MPTTAEPFTINVPDAVVEDILARVRAYPWDDLPDAGGWSCGTRLAFMRDLCAYWVGGYDWRAQEAELNHLPQFRAEADGLGLHFVHTRGSGPHPMPLILSHGWPGSFMEFLHVAEKLPTPSALEATLRTLSTSLRPHCRVTPSPTARASRLARARWPGTSTRS